MSHRSDPADTRLRSSRIPAAAGESDSPTSHLPTPASLVVLALTVVVAVPWYWQFVNTSLATAIIFGLPVWVWTSVLGSFAVSCCTWWLYQRPWAAEADSEQSPTEDG
jgi:hypothetical protein